MKLKQLILGLGLVLFFQTVGILAIETKCSETDSPLGSLIKVEGDDGEKIPLILIHGIHGTRKDANVNEVNDYWNEFVYRYFDDELRKRYALYIFQYCSDRLPVFTALSDTLGREIEKNIPDRQHVILAHSMGGLVAKSYMAFYKFKAGNWKNTKAGDSVPGLITLATPHHGTPGANNVEALEKHLRNTKGGVTGYFEEKVWKGVLKLSGYAYWGKNSVNLALESGVPNRSDLRWDNYDGAIEPNKLDNNDVNLWLPVANQRFTPYFPKTITYSGRLSYARSNEKLNKVKEALVDAGLDTGEVPAKFLMSVLSDGRLGALPSLPKYDYLKELLKTNKDKLELSNAILTNGLSNGFGLTDGMVPFESGLFCGPRTIGLTRNFECALQHRVRRFESGQKGISQNVDSFTLSINRRTEGYDHEEMYKDEEVLNWVVFDLKNSFNLPTQPKSEPLSEQPLPTVSIPTSPTLFLFDVSGSMAENNKIEQARAAGLDALREMRENSNSSPSPVSILTFSGNSCSGNVTQNLLSFTTNLTQAEDTMNSRIPKPDGGTPLPQALQTSIGTLTNYLNTNRVIKDGRIVVLSDGQSTCGEIRPAGVYSRRTDLSVGLDGRIKFLTVGFDVPPGSPAERDLQYLADISGGKYFNAQDRRQLIRAFQKLVRVFVPKMSKYGSNPDFANGIKAFQRFDYLSAVRYFRAYTQANNTDPFGWYNLGLALEALDRYQAAAESFRKYLSLFPNAPDRAKIEAKIVQLRQDRIDLFNYYAAVIQSDLDYLKRYYQSIFNRSSADLAREFIGFVNEKDDFYKNLPDILEINERWLINDSKDLSDSLSTLAERADDPTFDRDAVSLLTTPIAYLEELTEKIENYRIKNLR